MHVTLRLRAGVGSLRMHSLFRAVRKALAAGKDRFGFGLVHFSVQRDHLHLIAEAQDRRALSRGVQGLSIRVARAVNRQLQRAGRLFADRYHARVLKTPRAVRFALRYVLLGRPPPRGAPHARKHEPRAAPPGSTDPLPAPRALTDPLPAPRALVDGRSSAAWFTGFSRPTQLAFGGREARAEWFRDSGSRDPPVVAAGSWLLRVGLARAGPIDLDDPPGS